MYNVVLIFFFLLFGSCAAISGQSKVNFLEGNVTLNKATGFFGRNVQDVKLGVEAGFLRQLKTETPVFWGISSYYQSLGRSGKYIIQEPLDFDLVDFDYTTISQLIGFNGKLRFYPKIYLGKTEFYVEAMFGYKWLFTTTNKTITDDNESSDSNIEKGSLSLTYGVAAGLNYPVSPSLYLNLRANYLPGLSKQYYVLDESNTITESTLDLFDLKKSTTDIIRWDFGVTWRFTGEEF